MLLSVQIIQDSIITALFHILPESPQQNSFRLKHFRLRDFTLLTWELVAGWKG